MFARGIGRQAGIGVRTGGPLLRILGYSRKVRPPLLGYFVRVATFTLPLAPAYLERLGTAFALLYLSESCVSLQPCCPKLMQGVKPARYGQSREGMLSDTWK